MRRLVGHPISSSLLTPWDNPTWPPRLQATMGRKALSPKINHYCRYTSSQFGSSLPVVSAGKDFQGILQLEQCSNISSSIKNRFGLLVTRTFSCPNFKSYDENSRKTNLNCPASRSSPVGGYLFV